MKKSLFILLIVVFLGSCQVEFDDVTYTITNISSKSVSFSFCDTQETITLDKEKSISYTINSGKGMFAPEKITFEGHPRSIDLYTLDKGTQGKQYIFIDNTPLKLNVQNNLSIPVNLVAYKVLFDKLVIVDYIENYIDDLDEDGNPIIETYIETCIETDEDGNPIYETDEDGNSITDEEDNPIPKTKTESKTKTKTKLTTILSIGQNEYKQANIYTSTPNFIVSELANYPSIIIDWTLVNEDTINVIIR